MRRRLSLTNSQVGGGSNTGGSYTVNLNGQWEATTAVPNPDSTLYDGVYRSSSNYNVNGGVSTMYINIKDYSSFKMYIRSYAESRFDYVMVSQLDKTINGNTTYNDATLVKAHTRDNQQSGTALSNYTLVEFTGIPSGIHTITVVYRKDVSSHTGDDRGYVLIEKSQIGDGEESGSNLITFTIGNTQYQAEEGMTWGEWVDSKYNIHGYYIGNNYVRPNASLEVVNTSNIAQYANTIILNNATYRVTGGGASD